MRSRGVALLLLLAASAARAQLPLGGGVPAVPPAPPDPAALFRGQCGTCHTTVANASPRQGPNLAGVYRRKAGTLAGFKYSGAFGNADFVWDDDHLNALLTNPQVLLPGAVMVYRQANPTIRQAIIGWLKEQH